MNKWALSKKLALIHMEDNNHHSRNFCEIRGHCQYTLSDFANSQPLTTCLQRRLEAKWFKRNVKQVYSRRTYAALGTHISTFLSESAGRAFDHCLGQERRGD